MLTNDDITTSRKKKRESPRDNDIFELGLFMGCLACERCFTIHNEKTDLKLSADLAGIMGANYNYVSNENSKDISKETLAVILNDPCSLIAGRIIEPGTTRKLGLNKYLEQKAIHSFCCRIEGA